MAKVIDKPPIRLTVDLKPGPATLAQKMAWRKFWRRLLVGGKVGEH